MDIKYKVLTKDTAHEVSNVIKKVYEKSYSELYLPDASVSWQEHASGENIVVLAFCNGVAEGMISLKRSNDNKKVYELGMLSVSEDFRTGKMAEGLLRFLKEEFSAKLDFDAVYMENVTSHYYSQRKAFYSGSVDSAMMLGAMPELGNMGKRLSFVVGVVENQNIKTCPVYIPKRYADIFLLFYQGLSKRSFLPFFDVVPKDGTTFSKRREFPTLSLLKESITAIGSDFPEYIDLLNDYAEKNNFETIQLFLPLDSKHISFAADVLHDKNFFIGGIMPFWFGVDAVLMQKCNLNNLAKMKIFSKKAKKIIEIINRDKN